MSRTRSLCLLLLGAVLVTACSSPRKASQRACRKAERHLAKAIYKCPTLLQPDTNVRTVRIELPGDSLSAGQPFAVAQLDSLQAACQQLADALAAERDLYQAALAIARDKNTPQLVPSLPGQSPAARQAIALARRSACDFMPFTKVMDGVTVTVSPGPDGPQLKVTTAPQVITAQCPPCPPRVVSQPVIRQGVATWYRTFFWIIVALAAVIILSGLHSISKFHAGP